MSVSIRSRTPPCASRRRCSSRSSGSSPSSRTPTAASPGVASAPSSAPSTAASASARSPRAWRTGLGQPQRPAGAGGHALPLQRGGERPACSPGSGMTCPYPSPATATPPIWRTGITPSGPITVSSSRTIPSTTPTTSPSGLPGGTRASTPSATRSGARSGTATTRPPPVGSASGYGATPWFVYGDYTYPERVYGCMRYLAPVPGPAVRQARVRPHPLARARARAHRNARVAEERR